MTDKLLPCPLCGKEAEMRQNTMAVHGVVSDVCPLAGLIIPVSLWNTRAGSDIAEQLAEALEWSLQAVEQYAGFYETDAHKTLSAYRKGKE